MQRATNRSGLFSHADQRSGPGTNTPPCHRKPLVNATCTQHFKRCALRVVKPSRDPAVKHREKNKKGREAFLLFFQGSGATAAEPTAAEPCALRVLLPADARPCLLNPLLQHPRFPSPRLCSLTLAHVQSAHPHKSCASTPTIV